MQPENTNEVRVGRVARIQTLRRLREYLERQRENAEAAGYTGAGTAMNLADYVAALDAVIPATPEPRQDQESSGVGEGDAKARAEDAEEALLRVAELLATIGPDEVLDQDRPAVRGRRWVMSDEAGMRVVAAYRIALEAFTRHGHSHDYPLPPPGGTRSARYCVECRELEDANRATLEDQEANDEQ